MFELDVPIRQDRLEQDRCGHKLSFPSHNLQEAMDDVAVQSLRLLTCAIDSMDPRDTGQNSTATLLRYLAFSSPGVASPCGAVNRVIYSSRVSRLLDPVTHDANTICHSSDCD